MKDSTNLTAIELFSGSASFSKVAQKMGFLTLTIDNNSDLKPDITKDVNVLKLSEIPKGFANCTILWASPPCTCFSVAGLRYYWNNKRPSDKAKDAIETVKKTIRIIEEIKPTYWYIENPVGMLRTLNFMRCLPRRVTITYCQYGDKRRKPTDIWTNNLNWKPRKCCHCGDTCHDKSPRGNHNGGTQGQSNAKERGKIPYELIKEVINQSLYPETKQTVLEVVL